MSKYTNGLPKVKSKHTPNPPLTHPKISTGINKNQQIHKGTKKNKK